MTSQAQKRVDMAACGLTAACLAHCLALPLVASLLPLLGAVAETEWVHWVFVVIAGPLAIVAFGRRGAPTTLRLLAIVGVLSLIAGAAGFPTHDWETALSVIGALCLASAHTLNAVKAAKAAGQGHSHPTAGRF